MRIGVDGGTWANQRGYGRFTREILRAMVRRAPDDEWIFFFDQAAAQKFDIEGNVRVVVADIQPPSQAATAYTNRSLRDLMRLTRAVWRNRPDVLFSPSVYTFFPLPPGQRAVVTVHDAIPERYPELTLPTRRARWFWNAKVKLALLQSRLVLTVSEYSAREIAAVLGVPREKIRVAVEAPSAVYRPSNSREDVARALAPWGLSLDDQYFVYVGGYNPHKRVTDIVRAHAQVAEGRARPPHMLFVGSSGSARFFRNIDEVRLAIAEAGTESLVHWTGFVEDEMLRHLHSGAIALLLVSQAEGFGLPAFEAAACGAPVIGTRASPIPELIEGGGIYVEPGDHAALVNAMRALLDDAPLRARLGAQALRRVGELSWDTAADVALQTLREAAA